MRKDTKLYTENNNSRKRGDLMNCTECPYAIWDYETYYGTTQKQYFVSGCRKDKSPEECEDEDGEG